MGNKQILDSWKEISNYLNRDVKTCQRWEKELGLPVKRLEDSPKAHVFAYKEELDRWLHDTLSSKESSQKRFFSFIPVLVTIVLIIAGVIIWQLLPKKEPVPLDRTSRLSLAILYFKNNTGDQNLDFWRDALSDLMIDDLSQSKYIYVLAKDRLFNVMQDLNLLEAKDYSSKEIKQVAARGVVNHILQGSYARAGSLLRVNIKLQDANSGELVASDWAEGTEEKIFSMVDELTMKIKENLNLSKEEIAGDIDMAVGKITTSFPLAYRYFSEAERHYYSGNFSEAILIGEKAIEIDSEFATAYYGLAWCYWTMKYASKAKKYFQMALQLTDRISERERLRIQGDLFTQSRNHDKAIEVYIKLLELYPEDWIGNNSLGLLYNSLEEWEKSIDRLKVNLRNKVKNPYSYVNISRAYRAKGMYEKSEEILQDHLNNISDHLFIHTELIHTYLCQREFGLASSELNKVITLETNRTGIIAQKGWISLYMGDLANAEKEFRKYLEEEEPTHQRTGINRLVQLYLLQGKFEKSREQASLGIKLAEKLGEKNWASRFYSYLAYSYLKTGNLQQALKECQKSRISAFKGWEKGRQIKTVYWEGISHLKLNSMDDALRTAGELKVLIEQGMNPKLMRFYFLLMGNIELERKNFTKAIDYLTRALTLQSFQRGKNDQHALFIDPLALAYYETQDLERAQEEYERIISLTSGRISWGDIYAKSFYMLGKIYEQKDWKGKAIEHYEKFLDLWKDADPGIAEVGDARKRLAGLQNQ